jgi:hypothetical protein
LFPLITIISQDLNNDLKSPLFVEEQFKGGTIEFRKFITANIKYPQQSVEKAVVGLSISSCTITPDGAIENISIINPIDQHIDLEVKRVIELTKTKWNKSEDSISRTFYLQIYFILKGIQFDTYELTAENVIKSFSVTVLGLKLSEAEVPKRTTQYIIESIGTALSRKKYPDALEFINEAIRRNPFEPNLYQLRIMINSKLGKSEDVKNDIEKISNFIDGKTLQSFIGGV